VVEQYVAELKYRCEVAEWLGADVVKVTAAEPMTIQQPSKSAALKRELAIKALSRKAKEALIQTVQKA